MKTLGRIKATILREFWHSRSEALFMQFGMMSDLITAVWNIQGDSKLYYRMMDRQDIIANRLQNADNHFWYYAARDGK